VGFVVDKMVLGQDFFEYFGFLCKPHFIPPTSILTITRDRYNRPITGRSAAWTSVWAPPPTNKLKKKAEKEIYMKEAARR
jgi:hypothetical protein